MSLERNSIEWEGLNMCLGRNVIQCSGIRFRGRTEKIILIARYFMVRSRMPHICIFHEMLTL
jgi:hypothetical protein